MTEAGQSHDLAAALVDIPQSSSRDTNLADRFVALVQRMREAHALSGAMVAALEGGNDRTFLMLLGFYDRANREAAAAILGMDEAHVCEGSA